MKIESKHVVLFLAIAILMAAVGIGVAYNNQTDVSTFGKYGDISRYVNNVKLEEGSNITITPSGSHNSLIIASSAGTGDMTAVGDVTEGGAFTDGGASGTTLWFEGSTHDEYDVILTTDDPFGSDFTVTLQAVTGYVVTDVTACSDLEGDALSITTGVLSVDAMELTYSSAFASGDFLIFYETGVGLRRLDYDDLPAGGGAGITAVGDVSGAVDAFTADSSGTTLWFEGSTEDDYEVILTSDDASGADFTATLSDHTGYVVVDVTECWDLEGTGLSITTGALNWAADHNDLGNIQGGQATEYYHITSVEHTELTQWIDDVTLGSSGALTLPAGQNFVIGAVQWNSGNSIDATKVADANLGELSTAAGSWTINDDVIDTAHFIHSQDWGEVTTSAAGAVEIDVEVIDATHFVHSQDWGEIITTAGGAVDIDASVILAANFADEDWGEVIISSNAATIDISGAAEESGFTSGDFLLFYDTTAGANRKVNYDDLPAGGGAGITAVGNVSGAVDAFTADSAGNTLWFEGATANDYEVILTAADPTAQDWTITLPKATGYTVIDATVCTDLEGTALSITTGTLNCNLATTTTFGVAKFDSSGNDFTVSSGDVTLKDTDYVVILTAAGAITDIGDGPCQTKVDGTNFDYYVCDFDPDADEVVYWEFQIPNSYTAGNITPTVYWISAATTGDVEWEMQVLGRSDSEAYDAALGAVQTVKTTTDGTAGDINTSTFTAFSPGWAAGDLVIVKLYRNADDVTDDTMTTDASMLSVRISWPSTR